jgi:hypothetical protein
MTKSDYLQASSCSTNQEIRRFFNRRFITYPEGSATGPCPGSYGFSPDHISLCLLLYCLPIYLWVFQVVFSIRVFGLEFVLYFTSSFLYAYLRYPFFFLRS